MSTSRKKEKLDYHEELRKTLKPKSNTYEIQAYWTNNQGSQCKKII